MVKLLRYFASRVFVVEMLAIESCRHIEIAQNVREETSMGVPDVGLHASRKSFVRAKNHITVQAINQTPRLTYENLCG